MKLWLKEDAPSIFIQIHSFIQMRKIYEKRYLLCKTAKLEIFTHS